MTSTWNFRDIGGSSALDQVRDRIGGIYPNDRNDAPAWVTTSTDLFGSKETVPVERVRLGVDTVTEFQTVHEQVRTQQIDPGHRRSVVALTPSTKTSSAPSIPTNLECP